MTSYTHSNVAAAIATMSDTKMSEQNIQLNDMDALTRVMSEAETEVRDELIRQGMNYEEAKQLVERAASVSSTPNDVSNGLAQAAIANKGAPLPTANNDDELVEVPDDQQEIVIETQSDSSAAAAPAAVSAPSAAAPQPAAAMAAAPAAMPEAAGVPVVSAAPRVAKRKTHSYTIEKKKASAVFGLDDSDPLFAFDLPFINWDGEHPGIPALDRNYNMDPSALLTVLIAITNRKSLAVVGPHGAGKTKMIEQIGARLNLPVTVIPMDGQMTRGTLFGMEKIRATSTGPESYFQYGVLPNAMMEPGIIVFDEFDRADPSVQYACHSVYEQLGLRLLEHDGELIPMHPMNRVMGTANTKGRGSDDGMYLGAVEMSEATRDRFTLWIDLDYQSVQDDTRVIKAKTGLKAGDATIIARLADNIRSAFKMGNLSQSCSMRQMLESAELMAIISANLADAEKPKALRYAIEQVIIGRASAADRGAIETQLQTLLPAAYNGDPLI